MNRHIRISILGCLLLCVFLVGCVLPNDTTTTGTVSSSASTTTTTTTSFTSGEATTSTVPSSVFSSTITSTMSFVTTIVTITQASTSKLTTTVPITTATTQAVASCVEVVFDQDDTVYDRVTNVIGDYALYQDWAKVGDTVCLRIAAQFEDAGIAYDHYILQSSDESVATVKNNLVTVVGEGTAWIGIVFYHQAEQLATMALAAKIRGVDPSTWTEIRTAEELAAMNQDKDGVYVLKADIDLVAYGEWTPIGGPPSGNQFTGVFLNPDGYVISNLRISSAASLESGPYGGLYAGLFGSILHAVLDGVILENVWIDVTDYVGDLHSTAGAVVGVVSQSIVRHCYASGYVHAQYMVGGIVGSNSWGLIEHSYFVGEVHAVANFAPNMETGAGGIVGYSHTRYLDGGINDCHASGMVTGYAHAGGIVGSYVGERFENNTFAGSVSGSASSGPLIGFDRYNHLTSSTN